MAERVLREAVQRRKIALAALLAIGHQGGEALVPVVIGVVIDQAVSAGSVARLLWWLGALAVLFAVLSTCYRFGARIAERASEMSAHDLRLKITGRAIGADGSPRLPGELVNVATSDAQRVGALNVALPFGIAGLAGLIVSAVALLRMSIPLGLLVLLGTPPLLWLAHLIGKPLERRSEVEQDRAAQASGLAADLVSGLRVLKGLGAEAAAVARYRRTSQASLAATLRAARAEAGHDGAILALTGAFIAVVALVGAGLAADGQLTIGELVAAVGLAQFLVTPFQIFGWVNSQLAQARASAARIGDVLSEPSASLAEPSTMDVVPGELLGIAATDADELLAGLAHRPDVLVAPHDADLFTGTVAENIGGDVERAMAAAAVDVPADEVLAEGGKSLSGGQRQRVALARALAAEAPVLVLHEPTTAVDPVTEARIAAGIAEHRRGRSTILVTTSPALLAVTDRVLFAGSAATHTELLRDSDSYRETVLS
ncbi:ABC transporter ATP-binding protein [Amycolatopsis acidicola]|uniref:ABC transporter ATP-binding protein n=1 Tax=Amycolatopsis acidicola TaxID=2596893 RepID=A0A5N0V980_9PSEU|nr:ABC transporter ATP-binding protein [Amycolatopsis acidicola]KAA9162959.1 ABC transporter ATP-binding protein [Amycolatopsis acidicola]